MRSVTSKDGTRIAYDRTGTGPAVILVDGAMSYREYLGQRPLAAELSKGFTVITYDRRGRGESSDTQPYSVERESEMIEEMKGSPEWMVMEAVAPTLAYDNTVVGDGCVPVEAAKAATMPTLVLDGGKSPDFKHEAADALAKAMPCVQRITIKGQTTRISPEALAPVLDKFFAF